jgi:uncharacterized protein YndB with AHSA1/START domain
MKLAIVIIGSLVLVLGLIVSLTALLGSRLPEKHSATRSIVLHQTPDKVYAVTRDFASMPKWRADVRKVQVTTATDGRLHFREEGKHGAVNYELAEDVPGQRMVTQITDTDLGYSGKWTYVFNSEGSNTRLKITEDGVVSNVIFRFLSKYAFGHTATMDAYLVSLGKQFGEAVTPE